MRLLFSDGKLLNKGGRLHLIHLDEGWHVVGDGYVCKVEDCNEGLDLIDKLRTHGRTRGVVITLCGQSAIHSESNDLRLPI